MARVRTAVDTAASDIECAWIRDDPPPSRRSLLAEGVMLTALLFTLAAGLVIAMLPVPA